jgi:hypothetical protein
MNPHKLAAMHIALFAIYLLAALALDALLFGPQFN